MSQLQLLCVMSRLAAGIGSFIVVCGMGCALAKTSCVGALSPPLHPLCVMSQASCVGAPPPPPVL